MIVKEEFALRAAATDGRKDGRTVYNISSFCFKKKNTSIKSYSQISCRESCLRGL